MTFEQQAKYIQDKARFNQALQGFLVALEEAHDDKYAWLADELEDLRTGILSMEAEDRANAAADKIQNALLTRFGLSVL